MKSENNVECYFLIVGFGMIAVTYAIKTAFIEHNLAGSSLYCLSALLCSVIVSLKQKSVSYVHLAWVAILFFCASVINGNLVKVGAVVIVINMVYLLLEIINNRKTT